MPDALGPARLSTSVSRDSVRRLMDILKKGLLAGWICLLACSSASAYTLMAPLGGPPWPAEHDWTIHGCGIRGYRGGYTHVVLGSHDYGFQVQFSAVVVLGAALVLGTSSAFGVVAIRGLIRESNGD
jgi:hypothetical protein